MCVFSFWFLLIFEGTWRRENITNVHLTMCPNTRISTRKAHMQKQVTHVCIYIDRYIYIAVPVLCICTLHVHIPTYMQKRHVDGFPPFLLQPCPFFIESELCIYVYLYIYTCINTLKIASYYATDPLIIFNSRSNIFKSFPSRLGGDERSFASIDRVDR